MNTLQQHFLPYLLAKEFKELGFDEPCITSYWTRDDESYKVKEGDMELYSKDNHLLNVVEHPEHFMNSSIGPEGSGKLLVDFCVMAPLISQALQFLREKHGIHVWVSSSIWPNKVTHHYEMADRAIIGQPSKSDIFYTTYEQAQLAGIEKAVEIIKNKKP